MLTDPPGLAVESGGRDVRVGRQIEDRNADGPAGTDLFTCAQDAGP